MPTIFFSFAKNIQKIIKNLEKNAEKSLGKKCEYIMLAGKNIVIANLIPTDSFLAIYFMCSDHTQFILTVFG